MLKRGYVWAGIIGALLVVVFVSGGIDTIVTPSDIFWVNVANEIQNLLWICLGLFLIVIFFKGRNHEDAGQIPVKAQPNSPEDIESLRRTRNWIFGFFLLYGIISDSQNWVLNNFAAGLTLINTLAIFDLALNLFFFYIAIQLFRGKKDVVRGLLYAIIVYGLVEAVLYAFLQDWAGATLNILFLIYFAYSICAPLNRKNFRIAQFIILPIVIIFWSVGGSIDGLSINHLEKNQRSIDQTYSEDNAQLSTDYTLFIQSNNHPTAENIQNIQNDIATTSAAFQPDISAMRAIVVAYEKQPPDVSEQLAVEQINKLLAIAAIDQQQLVVMQQLMTYASIVNFDILSQQQAAEINSLEQQVDALQKQIETSDYKLNNNE